TQPGRRRLAEAIQAQLAAVGIALDVRTLEWGTLYADVRTGNFELCSLAWVGVGDPDFFRLTFDSSMTPPQGDNRGHYPSRGTEHRRPGGAPATVPRGPASRRPRPPGRAAVVGGPDRDPFAPTRRLRAIGERRPARARRRANALMARLAVRRLLVAIPTILGV